MTSINQNTTEFPPTMLGITANAALCVATWGSLCNLLTIISLSTSKKLKCTSLPYIISLAGIELLFCLIVLPVNAVHYKRLQKDNSKPPMEDIECNYFNILKFTLTQSHLQIILAIALLRTINITNPRLFLKLSKPVYAYSHVALIIIYSLIIKLPTAFKVNGQFAFNMDSMKCGLADNKESIRARKIAMILEAVIPITAIFFLYIFIFIKVHFVTYKAIRQARLNSTDKKQSITSDASYETTSVGNSTSQSSSRRGSANKVGSQVTLAIFIIFIFILISKIPVMVVHLIQSANNGKIMNPVLFLAFHITYWMQYCLDLIIYVLLNKNYRNAYAEFVIKILRASLRIICCVRNNEQNEDDVVVTVDKPEPNNVLLPDVLQFQCHSLSVIPEVNTSMMDSNVHRMVLN